MGSDEATIDKRALDKDTDRFKNMIKNRKIQSRVEHCPTATDGLITHRRSPSDRPVVRMMNDKAENRKSPRKSKGSKTTRNDGQPSKAKSVDNAAMPYEMIYIDFTGATTPPKNGTPTKKLSVENVKNEVTAQKPEVEDKQKDFVSRILSIEKSKTLKDYFFRNLMNVGPSQPKFDSFYKNRMKNRSSDTMCLEATRVKLKVKDADYIHANKIVFEGLKRTYIATQHPLPDTVNDFWSMIYHDDIENSPGEFPKFYHSNKNEFTSYGEVQVICKRITKPVSKYGTTKYVLEVMLNGYSQCNLVELYVYPYWPKNGVPVNPKVVMSLIKDIKGTAGKTNVPIVIQCENGVNQSAVFIYVDALINLLTDPVAKCDFDAIFRELRRQRYSSVSQSVHFIYSIYVVFEYLKLLHSTLKTRPDIIKMVDEIRNTLAADCNKCKFVETVDGGNLPSPTAEDLI